MDDKLPFSEACERNKAPILHVLKGVLGDCRDVLEIGSGSGQHAVFFARHLPCLSWQATEIRENLDGLRRRLTREAPANVKAPLLLDVCQHPWPVAAADAIFTANTLHIMSWNHVRQMFLGIAPVLRPGGLLCVYGPFRYHGVYTSHSNEQFDQWLKRQDPRSGIRDFEAVNRLATEQGLSLFKDAPMPAHNQLLLWRRQAANS